MESMRKMKNRQVQTELLAILRKLFAAAIFLLFILFNTKNNKKNINVTE